MATRLTPRFVLQTVESFHRGELDALAAAELLEVSRAHLFRLRSAWLHDPAGFALRPSGGDHHQSWPVEVQSFLRACLPLQRPPNCQLVADELATRFAFQRDRKSVAAYARSHFPDLVRALAPVPKPRRRWERSRVGELWQHDSSIHPWWPADDKQTLLLTVDDHSRRYIGGTFVPTDTTWNHFEHFRAAFLRHGCPLALYPDGLALFGHRSSTDGGDPRSEFQRALTALGGLPSGRPEPSGQRKDRTPLRHFPEAPGHPPALRAHHRLRPRPSSPRPRVGTTEPDRLPHHRPFSRCRLGQGPGRAAQRAARPCPPSSLLDLHLALHFARRCNADHQIDFLGRSWPSGPTQRRSVTLIHHPHRQFWVVSQPPKPPENRWSDVLARFSL